MFCLSKENVLTVEKSNVVYKVVYPSCYGVSVGKTKHCFTIRVKEQGSQPNQRVYQHLTNCKQFQELVNMHALPNLFFETPGINNRAHIVNAVQLNCNTRTEIGLN